MTRDELIRIAVQCQLVTAGNRDGVYMDALAKFAEVVAAAEREACAQVCDDEMDWGMISSQMEVAAGNCADLIRARGQA